MKYSNITRHNELESFRRDIKEALSIFEGQRIDEGLFNFSDQERDLVEKTKTAYTSKNVGVFIGRDPNNKSTFSKMELLRLDLYLKKLLKLRITHPVVKLLLKIVAVFLAIAVLSGLTIGAGAGAVALGTTALEYLAARRILGFAALSIGSGIAGFTSEQMAEKLAEYLQTIKEDIGNNFKEYIDNNVGKNKFMIIIQKILRLFIAKDDVEKEDIERSLSEV